MKRFLQRRPSPALVLAVGSLAALGLPASTLASPPPGPATGKEACKNGGWKELGFPNQGQCVKAANEAARAGRPFPPRPPDTARLDTTPPDTLITAGPTGTTTDDTPTFEFSSTEPESRFECSIDGGPFFPCSSPFTTPPLSPGLHTFEVRAIDAAGNVDPSPATSINPSAARRSFTVLGVALAPPVVGRSVNVEPLTGEVLVSLPGSGLKRRRFFPLREARQVPVGTLFDTRRGTVKLTSARNTRGTTQSGEFFSGVFDVLQSRRRNARGLTELRLKGGSLGRGCAARPRAKQSSLLAEASRRRAIRRLRGRAKGRFRTRGRYSAATVRGTDWTVSERCDGTLTTVRQGKVAVRDFRRRKTVVLRAGNRYLARARR